MLSDQIQSILISQYLESFGFLFYRGQSGFDVRPGVDWSDRRKEPNLLMVRTSSFGGAIDLTIRDLI